MFNLFQKKSKLVVYNESQKDELIEKFEQKKVAYKLRTREDEFSIGKFVYEFTVALSDLSKAS
ncbi:MAG: hypothetical protein K6G24_13350 [Lachnospiraceae bacterium]|nr:hypothetical protein [Lachnospiraceae bacterium]